MARGVQASPGQVRVAAGAADRIHGDARASRQSVAGCPRAPVRAATTAYLTYDQQLVAKAAVAQAIRYTQRSSLRDSYPGTDDNPRESLQLPLGNPRTLAFGKELRQRVDSDRAYVRAVLDWFHNEPFVY